MAKRKIVKIDEEKCNGCGECVPSCAEGAIQIIDGKAKLVSEVYCDGLGACLGKCPMDAISIEEREAEEFDEEKAKEYVRQKQQEKNKPVAHQGCPGSRMMDMSGGCPGSRAMSLGTNEKVESVKDNVPSQLGNWPLQLHLVPVNAPYFKESDLIIAADCVGFALPQFNEKYIRRNPVVIACPKLDDTGEYVEKLAAIFEQNNVKSITVFHMEVPCCSGIVRIVKEAMSLCGCSAEFKDITVGIKGEIK